MSKPKTIKLLGKDIPLTKNGFPNLVYVPKDYRELVKKYSAQKKTAKQDILSKELEDILKKLG